MESRSLLNLKIGPLILEPTHLAYFEFSDATDIENDYLNGFVRDSNGDGLVYQPEANSSTTAPKPLKQLKSNEGVIDATIRAQIRLNRLLVTSTGTKLTFCDLSAYILKNSYFINTYNAMDKVCGYCSDLEYNRTVHYSNGDDKIFYQGQSVEDLIDVDYCIHITPPELKVLPDSLLHDKCNQGLCKSSVINNERSAKCSTMFSIIVGWKTSLEICEK